MDELKTIKEAYGPAVPPTMTQMAQARAQMFGAERKPSGHRRRPPFGLRLRIGASLVAAGAAAAAGVASLGSEYFTWAGAKPGSGEASYGRDLPSRLLTPQDEVLWRKAGSPSKFRVWSNDHYYTYGQRSTRWTSDAPNPSGGGRFSGGLTAAQLQNLPTDPAELAALFFKSGSLLTLEKKRALKARGLQARPRELTPGAKINLVYMLLKVSPVPPAVRAGLMRALAQQPGVTAIGEAVDPLGRRGVALAAPPDTARVTGEYGAPAAERGDYTTRDELVFDRRTGEVLAAQRVLVKPGGPYSSQRPGFVVNFFALRDSGWTNTKPKPPAELPS